MPNAVSRLLARCVRRPSASYGRDATHPAARVAAECLEERRLLALTITSGPGAPAPGPLVDRILVPNTGINVTSSSWVGGSGTTGTYAGFDLSSPFLFNRLRIPDGVIITDGAALNALGPNDSARISTGPVSAGDPNLDAITGFQTVDASSLSINFTVTPGTQSILFDFIFGSDEYPEATGTRFADVFDAFLDGQPIILDLSGRPVSVSSAFLQVDNTFGLLDIEYDGLTPRLRTQAPLSPGLTSHTLKFVIADTFNPEIDSGVFLSRLQGSTQLVTTPVTDLPATGSLSFSDPTFNVDETGGTATVTVERNGGASGQVSVNYAVTGLTATAGADFVATAGTLLFGDGQTTQTITVPILDDVAAEGDETAQVSLTNPVDATIGFPNAAALNILDNEAAFQFAPATYVVSETIGTVNVIVSRSGPLTGAASVNYSTANGTALAGFDYVPTSGTLSFPEGVRSLGIPVQIVPDYDDAEPTEEFTVIMSDPTGAPLGTQSTATIPIRNVDQPTVLYDIKAHVLRNSIQALVLQFNDRLEVSRAQDLDNYSVYVHAENRFNEPPTRRAIPLRAAEYDVINRRVTLRPIAPMRQNVFYEVDVRTTTANGVAGEGLTPIDGNFDGIPGDDFVGYFGRGRNLTYSDRSGDKVKLGVAGGGVMEVFRAVDRDARTVRLFDVVPGTSMLFGKVVPRGRGTDRITDINRLELAGAVDNLDPAHFKVGLKLADPIA